jgi:hypothetical protein
MNVRERSRANSDIGVRLCSVRLSVLARDGRCTCGHRRPQRHFRPWRHFCPQRAANPKEEEGGSIFRKFFSIDALQWLQTSYCCYSLTPTIVQQVLPIRSPIFRNFLFYFNYLASNNFHLKKLHKDNYC